MPIGQCNPYQSTLPLHQPTPSTAFLMSSMAFFESSSNCENTTQFWEGASSAPSLLSPRRESYPLTHPVLARLDTLSHAVSVRSQIGQISCTTATLETGQDPPYEALEHHEDTSQLVGTKCRSIATRYTWSKCPLKHWSFRAAVA